MSIKMRNFSFNKFAEVEKNGARMLGFAHFTLVVGDTEFTYANLSVRVTASGKHSLRAPGRRYKNSYGQWRNSAHYKFDDRTYEALLGALFQIPDIVAVLEEESEIKDLILADEDGVEVDAAAEGADISF